MAKSPPYYNHLEEIPIKANYKTKEYRQKSKGSFSFFVVICSIFIYVSIFYIFNLSPSTFLYNNKFWFFISNTLILIIAADYGAFSSTGGNKNDDFYEEYVIYHSHAKNNSVSSSFASQYQEISSIKINITAPREEVAAPAEDLPEVKKEAIVVTNHHQKENLQENNKPKVVNDKISKNPNENFQENGEKEVAEARTYRRSKSDRHKRVMIDERKNKILRRSESEIREEPPPPAPAAGSCQEDNEFSSMSNEELNQRVEEFIQKFNRQIRLQRAGRFHEI